MAQPNRACDNSAHKRKEKLGGAVTSNDSIPGPDELHLADASNIVAVYALCIAVTAVLLAVGATLCLYCLGVATTLSVVTTLALFVASRHFYVLRRRKSVNIETGIRKPEPDLSHLPTISYLYVLGSGGHTTEMVALIKLSFRANKNQHRRYIITHGDMHSQNRERDLENLIHKSCPGDSAGTHDTFIVTRARKVYQSYLSSVYTSLRCGLDILAALTKIPAQRAGNPNAAEFGFPHVIVTNGPGTGFIVGLMAHLLKVLYLAPQDRLKIVFVETWARTHNLGLTGKLFHWTGIADSFVVQSEALSKIVDRPYIGNANTRWAKVIKGKDKVTEGNARK